AATGQGLGPPMRAAGTVRSASFSQDGGRFLILSEGPTGPGGEGRVWDAATGKLLTPALRPEGKGPVWGRISLDGQRVGLQSGAALQTWDAGTGQPIVPEAPVRLAPTSSGRGFSPDGRRFLEFVRGPGVWDLRVWDTTTGKAITLPLKLRLGGGTR